MPAKPRNEQTFHNQILKKIKNNHYVIQRVTKHTPISKCSTFINPRLKWTNPHWLKQFHNTIKIAYDHVTLHHRCNKNDNNHEDGNEDVQRLSIKNNPPLLPHYRKTKRQWTRNERTSYLFEGLTSSAQMNWTETTRPNAKLYKKSTKRRRSDTKRIGSAKCWSKIE